VEKRIWENVKYALFALLLAALFLGACFEIWTTRALVDRVGKDRVNTTGTVARIEHTNKAWGYQVDFTVEDKQRHAVVFTSAWPFESLEVGDPVGVAYSRSDPSKAYATGHRNQIGAFVIIVLFIAGVPFMWKVLRTKPTGRHLRQY
jgi:hypothetical protein